MTLKGQVSWWRDMAQSQLQVLAKNNATVKMFTYEYDMHALFASVYRRVCEFLSLRIL